MEQIGEVVELKRNRAMVRIHRASSCGENCAQCSGGCKPTSSIVEAENVANACVGDTVKLQMNSGSFLLLSFIGYILPIIVCIFTYFIVESITDNVIVADIAAVFSIIAVLLLFYLFDKLPRKSTIFTSKIIKIIK